MFQFNIFNNKFPETKHSHLSNGSQLISQTDHFFFVLWKTNFPANFFLKLCFFTLFTFDFNIFNDKIPKKKHFHLSNGSPLTLQTAHFFVSWKTNFPANFFLKLCFFTFFTFDFNIFSNKIPKKKHSHLSNGSRLTLQTVHFYSLAYVVFV